MCIRDRHKVYHGIERIAGNVITVQATGVGYRELAQVSSRQGTSLAQVIRLEGGRVDLQVFAGGRGIATDAEIRFLGHTMQVPFSQSLLGRVFNGSGQARDNGPRISENLIDIGGPSVNPAKRIIPRHMVRLSLIHICSDLFVHVHWGHNGTAISGSIAFRFYHTYAKGHGQAAFPTEKQLDFSLSTPSVGTVPQYQHIITEAQLSSASPTASQLTSSILEAVGRIRGPRQVVRQFGRQNA